MNKKPKTLRQLLLNAIGKAWMYWPPRLAVKKRCKDPNKSGWWICELCHQSREKIEVDHIVPCVNPRTGFTTWDEYINSRFVEDVSNLQGLCRDCHRNKTNKENKRR
jgi:5-methylcytosine-specific restriction endonuclease McrA